MSLTDRAFGGAVWSVLGGLLSRGLGLVGTLVMTHFLAPDVMGEVATATVLAFTVSWATQLGFAKYLILRTQDGPEPVFHVVVLSLTIVGVFLLLLVATASWFAEWFTAPHLTAYLPGMAITVFIRRIGSVPEKLLMRDLRFGVVAAATAVAEVTYTGVSLFLVARFGLGGMGIVIGNIVQSLVLAGALTAACGTRSWLTPVPLRIARFREILTYGTPLGIQTFLYEFARYGDKLFFSRMFGPARTGEYSLAYNLAEVPANQVGEQVSNVLLPALMQVEGAQRSEMLVKAVGLQVAVILPMAWGLSVVAPTLVKVLLPEHWWGITPYLVVLAAMSMFRPVNALLSQYLLTLEHNYMLMRLEVARVVALFVGLLLLGQIGPVLAAFAVGLASLMHTGLLVYHVRQMQVPALKLLAEVRPALLSGILMVAAVEALRAIPVWHQLETPVLLVAEILCGGLVYSAAFALAGPEIVRDARIRLKGMLRRRR